MSNTVLFDNLGPRGRRRLHVVTLCAVILLAGLLFIVASRLQSQGQFAQELWAPLVRPSDPNFTLVWTFLLGGLANTFRAAAIAIVLSLVFGVLITTIRLSTSRLASGGTKYATEVLRGVPVVLTIFFAARVMPIFGIDLSLIWYIVIGLTVYNSVVISESLRAGILALPAGQAEAAKALGFTRGQEMRLIILPQAFRIMLPAIIGQVVVIVKDTSLGFIIGFEELLRRGQIAVQSLNNPLQIYLVVAVGFIVVNLVLGAVATRVERALGKRVAGRSSRRARSPRTGQMVR